MLIFGHTEYSNFLIKAIGKHYIYRRQLEDDIYSLSIKHVHRLPLSLAFFIKFEIHKVYRKQNLQFYSR